MKNMGKRSAIVKNFFNRFLSIALVAVIGLSMLGCDYIGSVIDKIKGREDNGKTKVKYVLDISDKSKDWDCMVVGTDGSSMVLKMNQTTFLPSRLYVKPKKDSDAGYSFLFKDNGLLDRMICNGTILYFGNYKGYKFDLAVIKPDGTIEYHYDNQTDINWDTYWDVYKKNAKKNINERSVQERSVQIQRNIFHLFEDKPFTLGNFLDSAGAGAGIGTCIGGIFFAPALVGCGIFVLSQIASEMVDHAFEGTAKDVANTFLDALGCVTLDPIDCASTGDDLYSLLFKKDVDDANKKNAKTNEAKDTIEKRSLPHVAVTGVSLDRTTLSLAVGEHEYLHATVSPANATNKFTDWTTSDADIATVSTSGLVTAVAAGTATITAATRDGNYTATCAVTVTAASSLAVGDRGPGGGIIFYHSAAGFTMSDNGQVCYYLEAAPNDMPTSLGWGSGGMTGGDYNFTTEQNIGAGRHNTALILSVDPNAPAAKACREYSGGGKTDWFLPSQGELIILYENKALLGNMVGMGANTEYWSSSMPEKGYALALGVDIRNGSGRIGWGQLCVRAVRAF